MHYLTKMDALVGKAKRLTEKSIWEVRYCKWCGKDKEFAKTDTSDMCNDCKGQ